MQDHMLDKGGTGQGMASRTYDKYGKRVMTVTPMEAGPAGSKMPVHKVSVSKSGAQMNVPSSEKRSKTY